MSKSRQPRKSSSSKSKKSAAVKRKPSMDDDLLNDLPDVPTTKIE